MAWITKDLDIGKVWGLYTLFFTVTNLPLGNQAFHVQIFNQKHFIFTKTLFYCSSTNTIWQPCQRDLWISSDPTYCHKNVSDCCLDLLNLAKLDLLPFNLLILMFKISTDSLLCQLLLLIPYCNEQEALAFCQITFY